MALKQAKTHQQRQQPRGNCKKGCSVTKPSGHDPWAFLELIDAPQWADLSLEADLLGEEVDDPWFHSRHKHHLISLADLNSNTTKLCQHTSNQNKETSVAQDRESEFISKGVDRKGQLNKQGHGQCWPRSQIKRIQLQKDKTSKRMGRFSTPQAPRCMSSGSSCVSEWEQTKASKTVGSCSERLSVSSSLQDSSNESSNHFSRARREDFSSDQVQVSSDTPTCSDSQYSGGLNSRSSSGASFYASGQKLRISCDLRLSKSTADYSVHKDVRSSVDSATTTVSGSKSEEQYPSRDKIIWEASSDIRNLEKESEECFAFGPNTSRASTAESITLNRFPCRSQGVAQRIVTNESLAVVVHRRGSSVSMNVREKQMETRGFHILSSHRNTCELEKGSVQQSKCDPNAKLMHAVAERCLSRPEMVNVKLNSMKENVLRPLVNHIQPKRIQPKSNMVDRISVQGSLEHFVQTTSVHSSKDLKRETLPRPGLERRRNTGLQQPTACGLARKNICKSESGEQDLVALVAQHNRKIRTLGRDDGKKQGIVLSYR